MALRFTAKKTASNVPILPLPPVKKYVTTDVPAMTGAMSRYPYSKELEERFTFDSAFDEKVHGAIKAGNTLWVPRESVPYATTEDYRVSSPSLPVVCTFTPRTPEQQQLTAQSLAYLQQGRSHIFEAPTGWGKTVAGGYIAASFGQPTLIVVPKEDLMHQWYDSLTQVLNIPPSMVGKVQQDECDWQGKQFVIGMVQSLIIPDRYPQEMIRYFGLMMLDECHQMAAECFVRVCQTIPAKYRLGFSATPTRRDGKTKLLYWHVGPVLCHGKVLTAKAKILVRATGWKIPPHIWWKPGRMMSVSKAMADSTPRNMEIVNFVVQSYKAGRTTLLLSDLKDGHLHRLFQMLTTEGIPGQDIGFYTGGMKKTELEATKKRRVVLATYAMCSTGTDVPHWDTLVLATPRSGVKQSVGRVLRAVEGKKQPVVLDLVDKDSIFWAFHKSRVQQYHAIGAGVVRVQ